MSEVKQHNRRPFGIGIKTENPWKKSRLKWARELKGISQAKLARDSGVSLRVIRSYEIGESDINAAKAITVYRLATCLGVPMEQLLTIGE